MDDADDDKETESRAEQGQGVPDPELMNGAANVVRSNRLLAAIVVGSATIRSTATGMFFPAMLLVVMNRSGLDSVTSGSAITVLTLAMLLVSTFWGSAIDRISGLWAMIVTAAIRAVALGGMLFVHGMVPVFALLAVYLLAARVDVTARQVAAVQLADYCDGVSAWIGRDRASFNAGYGIGSLLLSLVGIIRPLSTDAGIDILLALVVVMFAVGGLLVVPAAIWVASAIGLDAMRSARKSARSSGKDGSRDSATGNGSTGQAKWRLSWTFIATTCFAAIGSALALLFESSVVPLCAKLMPSVSWMSGLLLLINTVSLVFLFSLAGEWLGRLNQIRVTRLSMIVMAVGVSLLIASGRFASPVVIVVVLLASAVLETLGEFMNKQSTGSLLAIIPPKRFIGYATGISQTIIGVLGAFVPLLVGVVLSSNVSVGFAVIWVFTLAAAIISCTARIRGELGKPISDIR